MYYSNGKVNKKCTQQWWVHCVWITPRTDKTRWTGAWVSKAGKGSQQPLAVESWSYCLHASQCDAATRTDYNFTRRDAWTGFLFLARHGSVLKHSDLSVRSHGGTLLVTLWVPAESRERPRLNTGPGCEERGGPAWPALSAEPHPDLGWSRLPPCTAGAWNPSCAREAAAAGKGSGLPRRPGCVEKGGWVAFRNDVVRGMGTVVFVLFQPGLRALCLLGAGAGFHQGPRLGMLREAPGSAPGLWGHAGAAATWYKAPPARRYEPEPPCLAREQEGQRQPRPGGAPPAALGGAHGTAGARVLSPGKPGTPGGTGCPDPGAAAQECCAHTCRGAPVQKWEVWWGDFPSLCILKGLRTLPRSPSLPLEVPGWTTAAGHAKTWKTTIPLRSALLPPRRAAAARTVGRVKTAQAPSFAFAPQGSCSPSSRSAYSSGLPRALSCSHRRPPILPDAGCGHPLEQPTPLAASADTSSRRAARPVPSRPVPSSKARGARPRSSGERAPGAPTGNAPTHACPGRSRPFAAAAWRSRTHLHPAHSHSRTLAQAAWAADRRSSPAPPVRLRHGKPRLRLLALRSRGGLRGRRDPRHR